MSEWLKLSHIRPLNQIKQHLSQNRGWAILLLPTRTISHFQYWKPSAKEGFICNSFNLNIPFHLMILPETNPKWDLQNSKNFTNDNGIAMKLKLMADHLSMLSQTCFSASLSVRPLWSTFFVNPAVSFEASVIFSDKEML